MARKRTQEDVLEEAKFAWRKASAHWSTWRAEAAEDYEFYAGEQWSEEDRMFLDRQGRPASSFNRVAPMIDAVAGSEVSNRQEITYIPREMGDTGVNESYSAAAKYFRDECDAEDEESAAFLDCLTCGVGWTETRLDYDTDPDGTIVVERVDPFEIYVDPAAKRQNFVDARYIFRVRDMSKAEVEAEWPGATKRIVPGAFAWGHMNDDDDEEEPHHTIHGQQYEMGKGSVGSNVRKRDYRVVQYQYKTHNNVYRVLDPTTGKEVTFAQDRYDRLKKMFEAMGGDAPPAVKQKRLEVRRAFFLGDECLEDGPAPCVTEFSFKAITGKRNRKDGTWYGLVRPMKDPQRWANKFFSQILHIINSNAKGGLLAEADAFDDPRDAETRWAEADSIIWMKSGGINRVMNKPIPGVPADISNMMQLSIQALRDVTGINLEMLGMSENVQAGVLEYQRRQSGLMILATLFNSLRRYRKEQGRLMLYMMREYIPDGTLIRIQSQEGAQYVQLMKDEQVAQYDVVVDDAPTSPNLKEQVFAVMQVIAPQLVQMGVRIPPEALEYLPLPEALVRAIQQANAPAEGEQQDPPEVQAFKAQIQLEQQKAMMQAQLQKQKADNEMSLRQQEIDLNTQSQAAKLQLERERADMQSQLEYAKLQIDVAKLTGIAGGVLPGGGQDDGNIKFVMDELDLVQRALLEQHSHTKQAMDELTAHIEALAKPRDREVVRDEAGRVIGIRENGVQSLVSRGDNGAISGVRVNGSGQPSAPPEEMN